MAINKDSIELGISILKQINRGAYVVRYEINDRSTSFVDTDKIFCIDEKADKGYECVFINIENMSEEQHKRWKQLKSEIPNSSFTSKLEEKDYPSYSQWLEVKEKNITCIGWF